MILYYYAVIACMLTVPHALQSSLLHSQPKSTVGTPAYIAPEVLLKKEYDGKVMASLLVSTYAINYITWQHYPHANNILRFFYG